MSLTWPLEISTIMGGQLSFEEMGPSVRVEISVGYDSCGGQVNTEIHEDDVRTLRDWLSWYLSEGPEPETR